MERLSTSARASVLRCLIEGNSIASTTRITGAAKNTILDLLVLTGEACEAYHDENMVDLPSKTLQLDEVWSFVGCKEKVKTKAILPHPGDVWTWTALCADTKVIPSWRIGERSGPVAYAFCHDLAKRFNGHLQVTTDGLAAYRWAVCANFPDVDFAQLIKIYGVGEDGREVCTGIRKEVVRGNPSEALISTRYVERSNLTIRMTNRRFTRLTNGYSKKLENHAAMLALSFMNYNFCRKHSTLKVTPAQAAGVTGDQWTLADVARMVDEYVEAKQDAAFEAAFSKLAPVRTTPKTYAPTPKDKLPVPWYLDPESGGPPAP